MPRSQPHPDQRSLFSLLSPTHPPSTNVPVVPAQTGLRPAADPGIQMVISEEDGSLILDSKGDKLPARPIKSHSLDKRYLVSRYANIVSRALRGKLPVYWVELFAGPGRLYVTDEDDFVDGSPIDALNVDSPFTGYVFSDLDPECVSALTERVRTSGQRGVHVFQGNANDPSLHGLIADLVPRNALMILYLDPQGLDLHFSTIAYFAERFDRLDVLVNFSPGYVQRAMGAGSRARPASVLGVDPDDLSALREFRQIQQRFEENLEMEGLTHRAARAIRSAHNNAVIYQMLIASRSSLALKFFEQAAAVELSGQKAFDLSDPGQRRA